MEYIEKFKIGDKEINITFKDKAPVLVEITGEDPWDPSQNLTWGELKGKSEEFRLVYDYLQSLKYSFKMNLTEYKAYRDFLEKHKDCQRDPQTGLSRFGAAGGGTEVSFVPTGLGTLISVRCHGCGESKDITDIDSW